VIPDYQTLMRPVLRCAAEGEVRLRDVVDRLADEFGLSSEERAELLPSGALPCSTTVWLGRRRICSKRV